MGRLAFMLSLAVAKNLGVKWVPEMLLASSLCELALKLEALLRGSTTESELSLGKPVLTVGAKRGVSRQPRYHGHQEHIQMKSPEVAGAGDSDLIIYAGVGDDPGPY